MLGTIRDLTGLVLRRYWIVAGCTLLAVVLGAILIFAGGRTSALYEATATIALPRRSLDTSECETLVARVKARVNAALEGSRRKPGGSAGLPADLVFEISGSGQPVPVGIQTPADAVTSADSVAVLVRTASASDANRAILYIVDQVAANWRHCARRVLRQKHAALLGVERDRNWLKDRRNRIEARGGLSETAALLIDIEDRSLARKERRAAGELKTVRRQIAKPKFRPPVPAVVMIHPSPRAFLLRSAILGIAAGLILAVSLPTGRATGDSTGGE